MSEKTEYKSDFDDVFRTEAEKMTRLLIPLINEAFKTNYPDSAEIELLPDTHHFTKAKDEEGNPDINLKTTDCYIRIEQHYYHIELQSRTDGNMIMRMVEYDLLIALDNAIRNCEEESVRVELPQSTIIYLRHTQNTPENYKVIFVSNGNELVHNVPIVKFQDISLEQMLDKHLFALVPYYILHHEKQIKEDKPLEEVYQSLEKLREGIIAACEQGLVNEMEKSMLLDLSGVIIRHVAAKAEECERMVDAMSGKVLETTWEKAQREGLEKGIIGTINILKSMGLTPQEIEKKLQEEYGISEEMTKIYNSAEKLNADQLDEMTEDFAMTEEDWGDWEQ